MIKFGKFLEKSLEELGVPAILDACQDSGVPMDRIQVAYCGSVIGGNCVGQRILKEVGLTGIEVVNVSNACASGSTAFRGVWSLIASGVYDIGLAFGVEQMSKLIAGAIPLDQDDLEAGQGMIMPALYAMRAKRHMELYGTTREQLALVSVKNHAHSVHNPKAQYQKTFTVQEILASAMICDPLTLYQCCPTGDGASAAVLCAKEMARQFSSNPVTVAASVLTSGKSSLDPHDITISDLTRRTAEQSYEMAGIGPEDLDVLEVHDAFTIGEILHYENLGLCQPGEGARMVEEKRTWIGGDKPVNPSGGLLSKGHPLGATGIAQVAEIVWQLRGEAGPRQVQGASVGLTHCTGGGIAGVDGAACSIHILKR
jgi:benzoylsuccinyl-CoA thiolase BbsB subunit